MFRADSKKTRALSLRPSLRDLVNAGFNASFSSAPEQPPSALALRSSSCSGHGGSYGIQGTSGT